MSLVDSTSGDNDDAFWVSLGFSTPHREIDGLHIECGKQPDAVPGFQGLFLERSDQGESEYDLLEALVVSTHVVQVHLNDRGIRVLGLPRHLRLTASDPIPTSVVATFRAMAATPNGGVLTFGRDI